MKIAICEDNTTQQNILAAALDSYCTPTGEQVQYDIYHNGLDLVASMNTHHYDVLLLDILMPGFTGIEAAKEIRQSNEKIPIIFLTSSQEFAVESYRIHAFDYLIKPVNQNALFETLDRVYFMTATALENSIMLHTAKIIYILPCHRLNLWRLIIELCISI